MNIKHEYDDKGNHRLVANYDAPLTFEGRYVGYSNIATLNLGDTKYIAVTPYFDGFMLKSDVIYEIKEFKE